MKQYSKVELSELLEHREDARAGDYRGSITIFAWELGNEGEPPRVVSVVIGELKDGRAELRVQYEKEDYEEHKTNLLIQRAVKEARTKLEAAIRSLVNSN
ncbi:hypothetical protein [Paenibacillus silviterrae]|uniref:hypothetical protein n=1 Tax=Paenibacillus silviterrae TaxID=3242194 RepID=UPI002543D536|nr:hypothetical protein [Paenibacillus chinjuensis]